MSVHNSSKFFLAHILYLFLFAALILAISSCGGGGGGAPTADNDGTNQPIEDTASGFTPINQGFNDQVISIQIANDGSGDIYVGGSFTTYNNSSASRLIRFNQDGTVDAEFQTGSGFNDHVMSVAVPADNSGDVYVAGTFSEYNGSRFPPLIRLNRDGSIDNTFSPEVSGHLITMSADGSDDIYVARTDVLWRLNNDGTLDTAFDIGTGFESASIHGPIINSIAPALDGTGDILIGGFFDTYNGTSANNFVRLNSDGSIDSSFITGSGLNYEVYYIKPANDGSGDIYVSGGFDEYNGSPSSYIIRLNSDGSRDTQFTVSSEISGRFMSIALIDGGTEGLYVGGRNLYVGSGQRTSLVRLNNDGTLNNGFRSSDSDFNNDVHTILTLGDGSGQIYVGGVFTLYKNSGSPSLIKLSGTGEIAYKFSENFGFDYDVEFILPSPDASGSIYVSGGFGTYNNTLTKSVVRLDTGGIIESDHLTGMESFSKIYASSGTVDGSEDFYIAGNLLIYDANFVTTSLARLNQNGSIELGFSIEQGFNGNVLAMATDSNGGMYVGGWYSNYGGVVAGNITRLNSDGTIDNDFSTGTGFDREVRTIAISETGNAVYVGGVFETYNGTPRNGLIRLNTDGSVDPSFDTDSIFDSRTVISHIMPLNDGSGRIYVTGNFYLNLPYVFQGIIRLNANGSIDTSFDPGTGTDRISGIFLSGREVNAIALTQDGSGDVYIGGNFNMYNESPANRIVRLNSDGSIDTQFDFGTGFNGIVNSIALANDGSQTIYAGGSFSSYKNTTVYRIVALDHSGNIK